jgi:cobalt-zinc-cadmium efflux system membrane fusion protein
MVHWFRRLTGRATAWVPTLAIMLLLGLLAFWGRQNDWKLPPLANLLRADSPTGKDNPEEGITVSMDPADASANGSNLHRMRIVFPSEEAVREAGIQTVAAEMRPLAEYVTAYGMIDYDPSYYAELATRAPGTVWRVFKEIGDPVRKGEALALIEAVEVGKAKADFLQSLTQVNVRKQAMERLRLAGGSVAEATLRDAEAALREARIRLFNDQQRLLNLGLVIQLDEAAKLSEEQLVRRLRLLGLSPMAQDQLDPETATANLLPLTAPFDCRVVSRKAAPGEVVSPASPQFVVADLRHVHIDLDVHPEDMAHVRVGQAVLFQVEGKEGRTARAQISHISPEVNEKSRNVQVHAEAESSDRELRPHTFGTGRIAIREQPQAVVVPKEAVQSDGSTFLVFVRVSKKSFQARPVQVGIRDGSHMQVIGVRPGEEVVTTGSFALKSELLKDRIEGGD